LVEHGCIITKIYGVIKAIPCKIFANFMNWVSDERRKGDIDQKYLIIAECCKTIGNSSFGRTIINKNKHEDIRYGDEIKFNKCKNKFTFYNSDKYDNVYEIILNKKSIKQNMPLQVGCSVFDDSKLKMYQFYYDRSNYQYIEMDCDSAYKALTGEFEDLFTPNLKEEYINDKINWFLLNNYDKRTPGLFKIEFTGIGAIALCSEAYYIWGNDKSKYASKGIQKCRTKFNKEQYYKCLNLKEYIICDNMGFRKHNGVIKTYIRNKIGLTPIYTKEIVMNNGVNIAPLDL